MPADALATSGAREKKKKKNFRSQGINKHGIDFQKLEYSILSIRKIKIYKIQTL